MDQTFYLEVVAMLSFFLKNNLATYHDRYYFLYFSVCYYLSRYCMVLQGKASFGIFWYFSLNFSCTNYSIPYSRTRENVIVLKVLKVSISNMCITCKLLHIISNSHIHVQCTPPYNNCVMEAQC